MSEQQAKYPATFFMHAHNNSYDVRPKIGNIVFFVAASLVLLIVICISTIGGMKAFGRYQKRQDALNQVRVTETQIHNYEQKVKIAEQEAFIRVKRAQGIRKAQDEISATLTPLYIQFEMVHAMQEIAKSGKNNSVVFFPAGPGGIPLVNDVSSSWKHLMAETAE